MNRQSLIFCALFTICSITNVSYPLIAQAQTSTVAVNENNLMAKLRAPVSPEALAHKKLADKYYLYQQFQPALAEIEKALALAPFNVAINRRYYEIQLALNSHPDLIADQLRAKIAREPDNPLYPLILTLVFPLIEDEKEREELNKKIYNLAPDWAWGQYALSMLNLRDRKNIEQAIAADRKAIELEPDNAYLTQMLAFHLIDAKKTDEAITYYRKTLQLEPDHYIIYYYLWNAEVNSAKDRAGVETRIREQLAAMLARPEPDPELLDLARVVNQSIFKDTEKANKFSQQLAEKYPFYNNEIGLAYFTDLNGLPYRYFYIGPRAVALKRFNEIYKIENSAEKITALEKLLQEPLDVETKSYFYEDLFATYRTTHDIANLERVAKLLRSLNERNIVIYQLVAKDILDLSGDAKKALEYAQMVVAATDKFVYIELPPGLKIDEEGQRKIYQERRAKYLATLGRAYYSVKQYSQAAERLRESISLLAHPESFYYLGLTLQSRGEIKEAAEMLALAISYGESAEDEVQPIVTGARKTLTELTRADSSIDEQVVMAAAKARRREQLRAALVKKFIDRPIKEFDLTGFDGKHYKFSELRGKAVLINFWASW